MFHSEASQRSKIGSCLSGCSFTTDVVYYAMIASTIQFVSANLKNHFEHTGVNVRVLKCSEGSRHRHRIPKRYEVHPFDLRQLKMLDGRSLGAKSCAAKRAAEMVTEDYITNFAMQAAEVTSTEDLPNISKVERNTLIALNSLAGRTDRIVGFVKLGLKADRRLIDLGCDRQVGYSHRVLVRVTDTARVHVSEALVPNDAKGLTSRVVDLLSDIIIWVVENGDWRSRIDGRRWLWFDS
jgi:hypothetical protein